MNYRSMNLQELSALLRKRKLGSSVVFHELNKVYGVVGMPKQQEEARLEAIRMLEEYDKNKFTLKKFVVGLLAAIGAIASLVTIVQFFMLRH